MERELTANKTIRTLTTFMCGVTTLLLFMQMGTILQGYISPIAGLLIEMGTFILACIFGCALSPLHPFRAGSTVTAGVFVGAIVDVIIHPTFNGFERNLFPLEIAAHTIMAALSCFLCATFWKIGSNFVASGGPSA